LPSSFLPFLRFLIENHNQIWDTSVAIIRLNPNSLRSLFEEHSLKFNYFRIGIVVALLVTAGCVIGGVAFSHKASLRAWWVNRSLRKAGVPGNIRLNLSGDNAILTGTVGSRDEYVTTSEKAAAIVGMKSLINKIRVENDGVKTSADERIGTIDIAVNTFYDDSPASLQQISAILKLPQFELANVVQNSTLSGIILDRFGFGPSDLPLSYRLLEASILVRNNLPSPSKLPTGSLKVPILPKRTFALVPSFAPHASRSHSGFTLFGLTSEKVAIAHNIAAPAGLDVESVVSDPPKSSNTFILQVPVTRNTAAQVRSIQNLPFSVSSHKMKITFASAQQSSTIHATLSGADLAAISSAVKLPLQRKATVFVLDSGWPDAANYATSLAELHRLINLTKAYYGQPAPPSADPPFVPLAQDKDSQHAAYIRNSLAEFSDLDKQHAVTVVYVPLTRAQKSDSILCQLLQMYYLRRIAGDSRLVDDKTILGAQQFADTALSLDTETGAIGKSPYTEGAIVDAIWSLADFAATQDLHQPAFFINESWTVDGNSREEQHSGLSAGIAVAAVGNDVGKVVDADFSWLDFAGQCLTSKSVIAALDVMPGSGLYCDSNKLDTNSLKDSIAGAFDGEVGNGVCGTSFSAPRLAWMLALGEAVRTQPVSRAYWSNYLIERLANTRTASNDVWTGLYVHPAHLFK
jgi:hypothetical protein